MAKTFRLIRDIASLPVSVAFHHAKKMIKRKLFSFPRIRLEDELIPDIKLQNLQSDDVSIPLGLLRANFDGSSADRIMKNEFDLPFFDLKKFGKYINWDFGADQDPKIPWELGRFQFLLALCRAYEINQNESYAEHARSLIHDFILKNPYGHGVHWKVPMEAAIRACQFSLAWFFLKDTKSWRDGAFEKEFLKSLIEHGKFIFALREYGAGYNGNHLVMDLTGLLTLGILFPQLRDAEKWKRTAVAELEHEMQTQVYEDGVHFEASLSYHRFVAECFGWVKLLCRENNIPLSHNFLERLEKMFDVLSAAAKPNGQLPAIGDCDDGFLLKNDVLWLREAIFEENKKIAQTEGFSRGFLQGGLYILRGNNLFCCVDCGGNGQNGNAGHAHNDTLSFELSIGNEDFIIDPGTFCYTADPAARFHFRGTTMHNTVMIDGKEMNRFRSDTVFRMHDDAKPTVREWKTNEAFDRLDAEHNGYARLKQPVIHRRIFELDKKNDSLAITDSFQLTSLSNASARREREQGEQSGSASCEPKRAYKMEWNFHFAPCVTLSLSKGDMFAEKNGIKMTMQIPAELMEHAEIREDFVSPRYGTKEKAKVLTIRDSIRFMSGERISFQFAISLIR